MGKVGFESKGHDGARRATYADLEAVPEHLVAEIIDGELVTHPRPAPKHTKAATSLGIELGDAFERGRSGPGGWVGRTRGWGAHLRTLRLTRGTCADALPLGGFI